MGGQWSYDSRQTTMCTLPPLPPPPSLPLRICLHASIAMSQLTLPESDTTLPSATNGPPFSAANRWFDFRNATIPWEEYQGLSEDPEICRPNARDGGNDAFGYQGGIHQVVANFSIHCGGVFFLFDVRRKAPPLLLPPCTA